MSSKTLATQLSQPYAEALLELAQQSDILSKVNEDITVISQILSESSSLTDFLGNPLINRTTKKEAIKNLFTNQVSSQCITFMLLLVDRKRINYLQDILDKYLELSYSLDSVIIANITSSIPLTDKQQNKLIDKLKSMTGKDNVKLELSVDDKLIAGFTIQIGSKIIDTSLRGQLKDIGHFLGVSNL
uniref:ATP synthase subunit delta, chloroplastic n=1 Tax=Liagoropsis maxima TaxID=1653392 RepID=A0A1G4NVQ5_9FLOR|nr:ATP synthase CF1 subunit delta [Liagoropsis maxima]SCW22771.1 ATP synthase CF1 subunit delta [Liagoropsis maxima]